MADRASILCVGEEPDFVRIRCAVLDQAGYCSRMATARQVTALLASESFDLIIFSAELSGDEKGRLLSTISKTPILMLTGFTFPTDLLADVERLLAPQGFVRPSVKD